MKLGTNGYLVLETYGKMNLILYALQILDKFTLCLLFREWKDIGKHEGMNGALGFPDLLQQLAPTLAGFQPRTSDIPSDHLTTRPYRTTGRTFRTYKSWVKSKQKAQSPNKHHHYGGGAAKPSGSVDLMNRCHLKGGWPCACLFPCPHRSNLLDSIN